MSNPNLHHIILTVADTERAYAFYHDVLGFEVEREADGGFYCFASDVMLFFYASRQPLPGDRFSEFRVGLDHLSFTAESRESLEALAQRLLAAGVETNGVEVFGPTGNLYVAFRDPDNIQLEYWLP